MNNIIEYQEGNFLRIYLQLLNYLGISFILIVFILILLGENDERLLNLTLVSFFGITWLIPFTYFVKNIPKKISYKDGQLEVDWYSGVKKYQLNYIKIRSFGLNATEYILIKKDFNCFGIFFSRIIFINGYSSEYKNFIKEFKKYI